MKIAIIGSSGVIGHSLVPQLLQQGHTLHLANRHATTCASYHPQLRNFSADIFDIQSLLPVLQDCELVINLATAIPKAGQCWDLNDKIRREGTRHLLCACKQMGIKRYIQQSIAMLYCSQFDEWLDETSAFSPNSITQSAADMERLIQDSNLDWIILRGGLLYGPGTNRENLWRQQIQEHKLFLPKNKKHHLSLIHIDDFSKAFVLASMSQLRRTAMNVVDDEPVRYEDLYDFIATQEGVDSLPQSEIVAPFSFRIRNQFIKTQLSWQPHYYNYRLGLAKP